MIGRLSSARKRFVTCAMGAGLFALALACYWPALRGGMLWDDPAHVTPPHLRSWEGLVRIWSEPHVTQQYYPVLYSAFWFEHRLWGDTTLGYHLLNVALHALAGLLFAITLRRLWSSPVVAGAPGPAKTAGSSALHVPNGAEWIAAVLFVVHPVCVESVAWISEQKNVLSLVFYLCAALAYLRFDANRHKRWYAAASLLFLLALGTKTVTATLPAALLVVGWWKYGRLNLRRDVVPLLPWFAAAVVAGAITARVEYVFLGARGENYALSLAERVLLASRVVWFYLGKLVWPADLMFVYPRWDVTTAAGRWFFWLLASVVLTGALWWLRRRTRGPLAAWLFYVGSLFPALGFFNVFPFVFSYVADHFQYLPSLGGFAVAGVVAARALTVSTRSLRWSAAAVILVAVAGLATTSNRQASEYRDAITLYRATLARNPNSWLAHNNLAVEIEELPAQIPEAIDHYAEALRLNPRNAEIHNNYGNLLMKVGRRAEAIARFSEAVRLDPVFLPAQLNLAHALAGEPGRVVEAMQVYREALRENPGNAEIHHALAATLSGLPGHEDQALIEYDKALRLLPKHAEARAGRAELLARIPARRAEAGEEYRQALRLAPSQPKTHYNFGVWLEAEGREAEAIAEYAEALRLDPHYVRAQNNLGIIHARRGEFDAARVRWEAALRTAPEFEEARRNLQLLEERTRK